MKRTPITPLLLGLLVLPGCPSDGKVLWLASDMDELHIKLVESEPGPF